MNLISNLYHHPYNCIKNVFQSYLTFSLRYIINFEVCDHIYVRLTFFYVIMSISISNWVTAIHILFASLIHLPASTNIALHKHARMFFNVQNIIICALCFNNIIYSKYLSPWLNYKLVQFLKIFRTCSVHTLLFTITIVMHIYNHNTWCCLFISVVKHRCHKNPTFPFGLLFFPFLSRDSISTQTQ